jgi:RNA polymerase sigma factor (sigma-70 family)
MGKRATSALDHLLQAAVKGGLSALNDRELLRRFGEEKDEEAFAALVRRHGGMVLGACRRALPNWQDAEDAFQATFLVLAQKASSGHWQASIANWLFTTARKVARNARVAAARRARREGRAAVPETVAPIDQMTGRELLAILDEELGRLPPRYCEPLVLCYLEGLTRDEAATQLGVPPSTLKSHLERGRKRLADALTKRGCALGAGLLALAATSSAGAESARLANAVLAAVGEAPSAAVAALAEGITVKKLVNKSVLAMLALLGTCVLAAGAWVSGPMPGGPPPLEKGAAAKVGKPAAKPGAEKKEGDLTFFGRVVGPDGKAVAGARVMVVPRTGKKDGFPPLLSPQLTGADGRFRFTVPQAKTFHKRYPFPVPALVATAPGCLPGWDVKCEDVTLRLAKEDSPVSGRVVTLEGRPVAGATVRVLTALASPSGSLDAWLSALKARRKKAQARAVEQTFLSANVEADLLPGVTVRAKTDAAGRFRLSGYGKDRVLRAVVEGPTIASREVRFVTRDMKTIHFPTYSLPGIVHDTPYYGTRGAHAAAPTRLITGVVRDRETKRPIGGVVIKSFTLAPHAKIGDQFLVQTTTDAAGKFTLIGMPQGEGNTILAVPDDRQPYSALRCRVPNPPGLAPVSVEIGLVRGVWIEGKVTDRGNGKPVARAEVGCYPDAGDNKTVRAEGLRDTYDARERFHPTLTGPDGKFRVLGLPGKSYLTVRAWDYHAFLIASGRGGKGGRMRDSIPVLPHTLGAGNYHAVYQLDLPAVGPVRQPVMLSSGLRFVAEVVGPDGKAVAGTKAFGAIAWARWSDETKPGRHWVESYNPRKARLVLFRHADKNLVGRLKVPESFAGGTVSVKLTPGVVLRGRIVSADGEPMRGVRVGVSFQLEKGDAWCAYVPEEEGPVTDGNGRFRVAGVVPGFKYGIVVNDVLVQTVKIDRMASGDKDVGDVRLGPRE